MSDNLLIFPMQEATGVQGIAVERGYRRRPRKTLKPRCCGACMTREAPEWRRGPQGPASLCNACGLRYMKLLKEARKARLPAPTIQEVRLGGDREGMQQLKKKVAAAKEAYQQGAPAGAASQPGAVYQQMLPVTVASAPPPANALSLLPALPPAQSTWAYPGQPQPSAPFSLPLMRAAAQAEASADPDNTAAASRQVQQHYQPSASAGHTVYRGGSVGDIFPLPPGLFPQLPPLPSASPNVQSLWFLRDPQGRICPLSLQTEVPFLPPAQPPSSQK